MKTILMLLCILLFSNAKAQSNSSNENILVKNEKFQISYSNGECEVIENQKPFEYGFIKVTNLTTSTLQLGFNIVTEFDGGCDGCEGGDESRFYIDLLPNQIYQATCQTENRSLFLKYNPNFSGSWKFENVRIENIDIIK